MESDVRYTLVGGFVITLLALIILGIIWLSSGLSTQSYTTYKIYMQEAVSGLSPESPVEYNGVNVGTVSRIHINSKNPSIVEVLVRLKKHTPVTNGTRAKLDVRSLTGISYIALEDKGNDMTPLHVLPGQHYAIIKTTPSFFVRFDAAVTQLNSSLYKLSNSVQSLLNEQNLDSIKNILINVNQLTEQLAGNSQQLDTILHSASKSAQMIENQTLPDVSQALANLNEMSRNLSDVSAEIKQNPGVLLRGKEPPALGPGEK